VKRGGWRRRFAALAAFLPKHEIDRVRRDPAQLGLVAESALEHGEAARHRRDV
jgi:hypothetical protein